jgi:hypothetical protein
MGGAPPPPPPPPPPPLLRPWEVINPYRFETHVTEFTCKYIFKFLETDNEPVTPAKDLGTTFDSNLSYNEHISNLTSSYIRKLCQINRVKDSFDVKTLQSIVEMLVINKLTYGSTIWSNTSAKNIKKLQTVQNFAARIITKVRKFDHITPSLQELNWLPI